MNKNNILFNKKNEFKKVLNGMMAEISSAFISYPLNTIKTNSQIGNRVSFTVSKNINNIKPLFKGFKYSFFNEVINGFVFYSIFEKMKLKTDNPIIRSSCGSIAAMLCSHPLYLRRKLAQVNKDTNIGFKLKNNYKGIGICMINGVPTAAINLGLKELIAQKLNLGIFSGFLSTSITMILSHPLDTLTTCILTKSNIKYANLFRFNGFSQRLLEKNLTLGTKLMLLDYLNEKLK